MKTIARIGTAVVVAITSVFIGAPAFANEEGGPKIDTLEEFSTAGQPLQIGAILIVGFVLLAIVLIVAQLISAPFEKHAQKQR